MREIKIDKGLNEEKVRKISELKNEPNWMTDLRVKAYKEFNSKPLPSFGPSININFDNITYYRKVDSKLSNSWENVDSDIKETFDDIGLIDQEKQYVDGLGVQYDSEAYIIYD